MSFLYISAMPRIKQNLVLTFASTLKAFLRLDAGIGRRIPGSPEEQLKGLTQQVQVMRQRLRKQKGRLKQNTTSEARGCYELDNKQLRYAEYGDREGTKPTVESAFLCGFCPSS